MTNLTELEKSVKDLKHRNENLQLALKTYELPEIQKVLIDWRTGELDKKFNKLEAENTKLKERIYDFAEANQSLRKQLDEEKAKNRIDYYDGSPMDYLDECERARRKNKIFQNWIKNINKELLTSELRKTKEGNLFIVNLLKKIDQVLGEE